jgi:hypothetical protein
VALTASQEARENSTSSRPGNTTTIAEAAIAEHAPADGQLIFRPNETLAMGSSISDTIDGKRNRKAIRSIPETTEHSFSLFLKLPMELRQDLEIC